MDQNNIKKVKPKNISPIIRQWQMLRMLKVSHWDDKRLGRWDKASEITRKLNDLGFDIKVRTVQRDLRELSTIFPIELNDNNPRDYGWRWLRGHELNIQGMSSPEALAMRLVEMQLKQQLPAVMLDALEGVFNLARKCLDDLEKQNNQRVKSWLNKIRVVQPNQSLLPPILDPKIQSDIYNALLDNRQISVHYQNVDKSFEKEILLHPLAIIMRGAVSYLVATAWKFEDPRLYALHRFSQVNVLDETCKVPRGFNVDNVLEEGFADFAVQSESIKLELRCCDGVRNFLTEARLSEDQEIIAMEDGWSKLTATVNDTRQLRWWLLSQGAGLEVCAPQSLRQEIKMEIYDSFKLYE